MIDIRKASQLIFREYDIRGIYGKTIDENIYYRIGRALALYFKAKTIAVGQDTRLSSPALTESLIKGIINEGVNVVDLGLISTEINYFASGSYRFDVNVIVTASHNPPEYNGVKLVTRGAVPIHGGNGIPKIKNIFLKLPQNPKSKVKGAIQETNILDAWVKHALNLVNIKKEKKLKLVIDGGNGMAGITWEKIATKIPVDIVPLNFKPDGRFPVHLPDPLNENNLIQIKKAIIEKKADLGFAMDGDADRLFVLDEKARVLSGTLTSAMLAKHLIRKYGSSPILFNVVCGKIVEETILKMKSKPVRVRVGHSFIKERMKKENALFAGEHSGHFYFRNNYYADSSAIAGLYFLEMSSSLNSPLSEAIKEYDKYHSSGEINYKIKDKENALNNIYNNHIKSKKRDIIDGISVFYDKFWFNLRASNTEPFIRLNMEADTKEILNEQIVIMDKELKNLGAVKYLH